MKLKYLLLLFTISLFTSSTCDKVSLTSEPNTHKLCDEIVNAAQDYWITNKDSTYAPDLQHYCDILFVEAFKDAFFNKDFRDSITFQEIKLLLGEPDKTTLKVGGIFNIYGAKLATRIDTNKTYQTVFYECVTNKQSHFDVSGKKLQTQKYHFLFEQKTGKYVLCFPMRGPHHFRFLLSCWILP